MPSLLIVDLPSANADLYWATRFDAPDPVIFLEHRGQRILLLSDLEYNRGRRCAAVDQVLARSHFEARVRAKKQPVTLANLLIETLRALRIRALTVPGSMQVALADQLRAAGIRLTLVPKPVYPARLCKQDHELRAMRAAQRMAFRALQVAESILRESTVKAGKLVWQRAPLTSERIHTAVGIFLLQHGYALPDQMIAAGGLQSIDPHHRGSGVLKPHQSIIIDIFPQDQRTRYFGDCTRTFCKGTPSDALARMYDTVKTAQEWAIRQIRAGINGPIINTGIQEQFRSAGFPTHEVNGIKQGFIHGTGHGLGLEIHEEPVRISVTDYTLRDRMVVTVEPGLYYPAIGGVRLEDVVCVTKTGATLLAKYPKQMVLT